QLYLGVDQVGDCGYVAAVLPAAGPGAGFDISDAITSTTLNASIVFLQQPVPQDKDVQQTFVTAVLNAANKVGAARVMMWTPTAQSASSANAYMGLKPSGRVVVTASQLTVAVVPGTGFLLPNNVTLSPPPSSDAPVPPDDPATTVSFSSGIAAGLFTGPLSAMGAVYELWLPFTGAYRGCIQFEAYIPQNALNSMNWGFQFRYPLSASADAVLSAPLARPTPNSNAGFLASIDPLDPRNQTAADRTAFAFLGTNLDKTPTVLASNYCTTAGQPINLTPTAWAKATASELPARLIFSTAITQDFSPLQTHLAPEGDFSISFDSGMPGAETRLLCGLHGTEYVSIDPSIATHANRLRFVSGQPAFAPRYPFATSSPVDAPVDVSAAALAVTRTPGWVSLAGAVAGGAQTAGAAAPSVVAHYVAQPQGAALYGRDQLINPDHTALLGGVSPAGALSSSLTI